MWPFQFYSRHLVHCLVLRQDLLPANPWLAHDCCLEHQLNHLKRALTFSGRVLWRSDLEYGSWCYHGAFSSHRHLVAPILPPASCAKLDSLQANCSSARLCLLPGTQTWSSQASAELLGPCIIECRSRIWFLTLSPHIFITLAFSHFIFVVSTLYIAWLFASIFGQLFFCSPMSATWEPSLIFSSSCKNFQAI